MRTNSPTPAAFVITLAVVVAALAAARLAHADDEEEGESTAATFSHKGQLGVHVQLGTGYRVLFPYNKEYCGEVTNEGEPKAVCTARSPAFLDAGLSFGLSQVLELVADVRLGLENDFSDRTGAKDGPRPISIAAGVRLFVDAEGKFKFFSTLQGVIETTDYSQTTFGSTTALEKAADFGLRNVNGVQFDFHRTFGLYAHFGETVTFANWLRFELHAGVGVQARFP